MTTAEKLSGQSSYKTKKEREPKKKSPKKGGPAAKKL
jgi:hypothetical protein